MKPLKMRLRPITCLLAIVIIIQSCTVYRSTPLTLEQAVQNESRVKVQFNNGYSSKYKIIIIDNGNYYGVKKNKPRIEKSLLEENNISKIKEKNERLSAFLSSLISPVTFIVVSYIIGGLL